MCSTFQRFPSFPLFPFFFFSSVGNKGIIEKLKKREKFGLTKFDCWKREVKERKKERRKKKREKKEKKRKKEKQKREEKEKKERTYATWLLIGICWEGWFKIEPLFICIEFLTIWLEVSFDTRESRAVVCSKKCIRVVVIWTQREKQSGKEFFSFVSSSIKRELQKKRKKKKWNEMKRSKEEEEKKTEPKMNQKKKKQKKWKKKYQCCPEIQRHRFYLITYQFHHKFQLMHLTIQHYLAFERVLIKFETGCQSNSLSFPLSSFLCFF